MRIKKENGNISKYYFDEDFYIVYEDDLIDINNIADESILEKSSVIVTLKIYDDDEVELIKLDVLRLYQEDNSDEDVENNSNSNNITNNTVINNTTINNTTINNNGNGNVNVNNGTINNNTSDSTSQKDEGNNSSAEEEKLPYKIETLSEADVNIVNTYHNRIANSSIAQNGNALYYISADKNIKLMNLVTGKTENVCNLNNVEIRYNGNVYRAYEVDNIYYDNKDKKLKMIGTFKTENLVNNLTLKTSIVSLPDGDYAGSFPKMFFDNIQPIGTTDNGLLVTNNLTDSMYGGVSIWFSDDKNQYLSTDYGVSSFSMVEKNGNIYLFGSGRLYKYNFSEVNKIFSVEEIISGGLYEKGLAYFYRNEIVKTDFTGRIIERINIADISVEDSKHFNLYSVYPILYLNSDENIIFYDLNNKCFRLISEN